MPDVIEHIDEHLVHDDGEVDDACHDDVAGDDERDKQLCDEVTFVEHG